MSRTWSTTFLVGPYTCSMSFSNDGKGITAEWSPKPTTAIPKMYMADYRRGRDAFLAEISKELGRVLVVET